VKRVFVPYSSMARRFTVRLISEFCDCLVAAHVLLLVDRGTSTANAPDVGAEIGAQKRFAFVKQSAAEPPACVRCASVRP